MPARRKSESGGVYRALGGGVEGFGTYVVKRSQLLHRVLEMPTTLWCLREPKRVPRSGQGGWWCTVRGGVDIR